MKSKLFSFLILFYCINTNGLDMEVVHLRTFKPTSTTPTSTTTSTTTSPPPTTTYPPSQTDNYLDNISIQDLLSSDIDASEKIEKKIINAVTEYSSNCRIYRKIHLSTSGFSFPIDSLTVNLDAENNAVFHNIRVSELLQNDHKRRSYSTLIGCDSLRMAKIEVKLPQNIVISADLKIIKITNSSKGSQPISDVLDEGSISFTMLFNTLSKQFSIQPNNSANYENEIVSKISYTKSEVSLNITTKFQMELYNNLETWFDQAESPIRQYLIEKLDTELTRNGISVADSCSKFITPEKNLKRTNLPFINNNFNNLYVIPNAKLETWKGVALSAGPILIDGLSSFNSTELIALESEPSIQGDEYEKEFDDERYSLNIPRFYDPAVNATTIRIKTNSLKGKLDWSYNSKQRSFTFTLEYIQFEVKKSESINYTRNRDGVTLYRRRYGHINYSPGSVYIRSNENKADVNVYLGNLQIKSSKSSVCENENEFVHFVLSEYLKTVIADSLKNSLSKKIINDSLFANCF